MADFRGKMNRFLTGRYGRADELYNALAICALTLLFTGTVLSLIGRGTSLPGLFIASAVLDVLSLGLLVWTVFRFLSRNVAARQKENAVWMRFVHRVKSPFRRRIPRPADTDTHVFRPCPACRSVLRLPRQPGKHTVRCPRCGRSFSLKIR